VWRVFDCAPFTFAVLVASVGADGAKEIANALQSNTTLTSIALSGKVFTSDLWCSFTSEFVMLGNNIDDDGAKAIAKALEKNTTLTSIDLSCKCFECHVCVYYCLMHVSSESLDQFHWWQSDRCGIAA
jgi:Pyruvate/2-oxoacid:ferredoxin oxidoreductase delta subunit